MTAAPLLEVSELVVEFPGRSHVTAVDHVDLHVLPGERVGVVGESGSGKSTLALAAMGLVREPGRIAHGSIVFEDRRIDDLDERDRRLVRRGGMSMVYQDPFTYLNPLMRVGDQVAESIAAGRDRRGPRVRAAVADVLDELGLAPGRRVARMYPHQLSGGQRQRVVIAMALAARPSLVIADEPTTALDVTVQAQILRALSRSIDSRGTALLLISHDLQVVRLLCDRIYVMRNGTVVESGPTPEILTRPTHPYTRQLLASSRREDLIPRTLAHAPDQGGPR